MRLSRIALRSSAALRTGAPLALARRGVVPALAARARLLSSEAVAATAAADSVEDLTPPVAESVAAEAAGESAMAPVEEAAGSSVEAATAPAAPKGQKALRPYALRMMKALKDRDYEQVLNEYDDMVEAEVVPDTLILNCLVEAKAHSGGTLAAREMLNQLVAQYPKLQASAQTYAALMKPCEYEGDTATAYELYKEVLEKEMPLHIDLFNNMVAVCTRAEDFGAAEGFFDEMRDKGVKPSSATYLKYIFAAFYNRKAAGADKAFEMLCRMESDWRYPDMKEYQRMLKQFKYADHVEGRQRCIQGIVAELKAMKEGQTDALSENPEMIGALFMDAQERRMPDEVVQLAETLKKAEIRLDRFQMIGVIFAQLQLNQPVLAFSSIVDLYDAGHKLPEKAYTQITETLAEQTSAVDESYFLLESRKQESRSVPLAAVNVIIEACALMGDLDRAFATWAELEQLSLTPDTGTFNALLHTCVRTREVASGRRLLSRMAQEGVGHDANTYMHQASLHIMGREDGLALKMLDNCREAGLVPNGRMYASLINLLCRARNFEKAQELVEDMEKDGHMVGRVLRAKANGEQPPPRQGGGGGGGNRGGGGRRERF